MDERREREGAERAGRQPAAEPIGQNEQRAPAEPTGRDRKRASVELTDPRALRAVAHPIRLKLIALLRFEGPMTATQAASRLGETPQRCTFHLNQLARYGLVEEAGGGRGRERPWRATASSTSWPNLPQGPEMAAAAERLESVIAGRYLELMLDWIHGKAAEPAVWQEAARFGDVVLYLTPAELAAVGQAIDQLLAPYAGRTDEPERRPEGSRLVTFLQLAFPRRGLDESAAGETVAHGGERR